MAHSVLPELLCFSEKKCIPLQKYPICIFSDIMFYFPLCVILLLKYCTNGRIVMLSIVIIFHMNLWINNCSHLPKCLLTDLIMPGDQIFDLSKWLWPISLPPCIVFQGSFHHFPVCLICWFSLRKYWPSCHLTYGRGWRANLLVSAGKLQLSERGGVAACQEWLHLPPEITSILRLGYFMI